MDPKTFKPFRFQEVADPKSLSLLEKTVNNLLAIGSLVKSLRIEFPKIYRIEGKVTVDSVLSLPPVSVDNLSELRPYFEALSKSTTNLQLEFMSLSDALKTAQKEKKDLVLPKSFNINKFDDLLEAMEELKKGFNILINQDKQEYGDGNPLPVNILNFPPQMVPTPVTNVTLNGLQGYVKSTATTVGTTRTALPGYGNLFDRRAVQIYNNDSSATLYVGGSDVSTTNGMPVPPLSYSPAFDAGYKMTVYGVSTSSINVRVIEVSKSVNAVEYD